MRKSAMLVIISIIVLLITGCTSNEAKTKEISPEEKLVNTVEGYNQTLINVMNNGNSELLKSVAMEKEVRRIQLFLSSLNAEQKKMTAKLLQFEVKSVEANTNQSPPKSNLVDIDGNPVGANVYSDKDRYSLVQTEELWEHQNYDQVTGEKIGEPFKLHYVVTYWLVDYQGKLLVHSLRFEERPVE